MRSKSIEKTKQTKKKTKEKNIQKLALAFIESPTEENFGKLCERINWGLRGYIYKIVKDDSATTEVLTKTLENIYYKRDQFNTEIAQFSTWMYRIALNNSLKYIQEQTRNKHNLIDVDFEELYDSTICTDADKTGPADSYSIDSDLNLVKENGKWKQYGKEEIISEFYDASVQCIDYLPDNFRVVLHERLVNSKKLDDIAYDNNIPISSVKNWLRKGRIALQEIIKERHPILYDMYADIAI